MNGACNGNFPRPLGPWEGVKRSNIIKSNYKVNLNDFYTKLCVCSTNERYKTYQTGFSFGRLALVLGVGLGGT